jgi:hypothetical protein
MQLDKQKRDIFCRFAAGKEIVYAIGIANSARRNPLCSVDGRCSRAKAEIRGRVMTLRYTRYDWLLIILSIYIGK